MGRSFLCSTSPRRQHKRNSSKTKKKGIQGQSRKQNPWPGGSRKQSMTLLSGIPPIVFLKGSGFDGINQEQDFSVCVFLVPDDRKAALRQQSMYLLSSVVRTSAIHCAKGLKRILVVKRYLAICTRFVVWPMCLNLKADGSILFETDVILQMQYLDTRNYGRCNDMSLGCWA